MLLLIAIIRGQFYPALESFWKLDAIDHILLFLTCVFGFSIGLAYFFLLKLVSNTSVAIANTFYKLITLLASLLFWGVEFKSAGFFGILLSFSGIGSYVLETQSPQQNSKRPPEKIVSPIEEEPVRNETGSSTDDLEKGSGTLSHHLRQDNEQHSK